MKSNKKITSVMLAAVFIVISSFLVFAENNADSKSDSKITTYRKTTTVGNGIFKSNTVVNGKVVSEIKYPLAAGSKYNIVYYPKNGDKLISYQPITYVKELRQQIDNKVESIRADVNARIYSVLSGIPIYKTEPTSNTVFEGSTESTTNQQITKSTTEVATAAPIDTNNNKTYSEYVKKVAELTNIERTNRGLQPLVLNDALCKAAQGHAEDMSKNNYFSHTSQDGRTMSDRINKYLSNYSYAGENIAAGYGTPESAVQGWMNSDGHRANILDPNYKYIGVGYSNGYWVQDFSG